MAMEQNSSERPGTAAGAESPLELKTVEWVRAVRDAMYEETRALSAEEFAACVARKAAALRAPAP